MRNDFTHWVNIGDSAEGDGKGGGFGAGDGWLNGGGMAWNLDTFSRVQGYSYSCIYLDGEVE